MALQDFYNTGDDDYKQFSGSTWNGQTFTASGTYRLTSIKFLVLRVFTPSTVTVSIRATTGGLPSDNDLCTETFDGDTLTSNAAGEWKEITFSSPIDVVSGTKYAIIVRSSDAYLRWRADTSSPTYTNGNRVGSVDSGSNWTADASADFMFEVHGTTLSVADIQQVRMGAGGDFLVAFATDGAYISSNLGDNWTKKLPDGSGSTTWSQGICSDDGTYIIAVSDANAVYRSANGGTDWAQITPAGGDTFSVNDLAISDDGQYVAIVGQNSSDPTKSLYLSTDYGATWVANNPIASSIEWTECGISNDGTTIAVDATGYFYVSFDSGVSWLPQGLATSAEVWSCFGISGDGTRAVVANTGDNDEVFVGVKTSLYSRATWAEADLTSAGRALLDDANAAVQATTLGLGAGDNVTHNTLTLAAIAAEAADVDKFLVDSTGVIKFRTGAQVLSDIGAAGLAHLHDGDTLQADGINSDGGAFNFNTTGAVSFNQNIVVTETIDASAGKVLVEDNNTIEPTDEDDGYVGVAVVGGDPRIYFRVAGNMYYICNDGVLIGIQTGNPIGLLLTLTYA